MPKALVIVFTSCGHRDYGNASPGIGRTSGIYSFSFSQPFSPACGCGVSVSMAVVVSSSGRVAVNPPGAFQNPTLFNRDNPRIQHGACLHALNNVDMR